MSRTLRFFLGEMTDFISIALRFHHSRERLRILISWEILGSVPDFVLGTLRYTCVESSIMVVNFIS